METPQDLSARHFDAVVVGSGPAGASLARDLTRKGKSVLILERGGDGPVSGSLVSIAKIMNVVKVGERLAAPRAFTTGGTTSIYFGVADDAPLETMQSLGIDLSRQLAEAKRELPLGTVPDELIGEQALRVRDGAESLGYAWRKNMMLADFSKCAGGYSRDARWSARSFVREAVGGGAVLLNRAQAVRVLIEDNRAVGVEYKVRTGRKSFEIRRAFGTRIVLSAGGAATPNILRESGFRNAAADGFYIHPCFVLFGMAPGLRGRDTFVGAMKTDEADDIAIGDGNFDRTYYRMFMIGGGRLLRAFLYSRSVGIGVMVKDGLRGELRADGHYHKELSAEEKAKLEKGAEQAERILRKAGAKSFYRSPVSASHVGGTVRIREHIDENLETETANLHVCDGSVLPQNEMISPTLTLVCLGKYLAERLAPSL